jgi:aryl-alcohol dehydrogenase-like predicted oxidoreductase
MLRTPGTADLSHFRENLAVASLALTDAEFESVASLVT